MVSRQNGNNPRQASGLVCNAPESKISPKHDKGISSGNPIPCRPSRHYLEELLEIQSLLDSILTVIRYGREEEIGGLLDCIRSGASLPQIRYHLRSLGTRTTVKTGEVIKDVS